MKLRTLKGLGVSAVLGVLALGGVSQIASAAPLVDGDAKGSLTVHKYETPPTYGPEYDGMVLDASSVEGLEPLAGATFSVQKVEGIDLSTNQGWLDYRTVYNDFSGKTYQGKLNWSPSTPATGLGTATTKVTSATGAAVFSDLPVGLYYVKETSTPTIDGKIVSPVTPFLITIPITDPTNLNNWVYDVNVYPKNAITGITKSVTDSPIYTDGEEIVFGLDSAIPGGQVPSKYIITDQLDSRVTYKSTVVKVGTTVLAEGTDYTVTHANGLVTVTMLTPGLEKGLAALRVGTATDYHVDITAVTNAAINGTVENQANIEFENVPGNNVDVDSNKVLSKWGGVNLLKQDKDTQAALEGAVFEIWSSHTNDFSTASRLTVDDKTSWTTDQDGKLTVTGLRYTAFADNKELNCTAAPTDKECNFYWLKEVKSPDGYQLLAEPVPFTVSSDVATAAVVTVNNVPKGSMPLTGAAGIWGISAAALAGLAIGTTIIVRSRKREA